MWISQETWQNRLQLSNMNEKTLWERIVWYQFLFSIFVIWCHAENTALFLQDGAAGNRLLMLETEVVRYFGRLGVAGFYLCSGYLFYRNFTLAKLAEKWKSRVYTLLLPYFIWNFIYYLVHYLIPKIPGMENSIDNSVQVFSWQGLLDALIHYRYNPIFWYLQYLIIFVILCPVLYLALKNRYLGAAFLLVLLVLRSGYFIDFENEFLGALGNWLVVYGAGAYAGLHFKTRIEHEAPSGLILAASGILAVICAVFYTRCVNVVFSIIYFLAAPIFIWLLLQKLPLPAPGTWMKNTFFVYASHHLLVRMITKVCAVFCGGTPVIGILLFLLAPAYSFLAAAVCRRICVGPLKSVWKVLTGDR